MNNELTIPAKLSISKENPFKGDLFSRRALADKLTKYISRLKNGCVIGIDAPWGEGKTWFGQNWCNDLDAQNYKVLYIDSFKNDYIDDPFLLIASEIQLLIDADKTNSSEFKTKTASVIRAIMPITSKILMNAIIKNTLGISNATESIAQTIQEASEDVADEAKEWIEHSIATYQSDKKTLSNFVSLLSKFCSEQEKPVVIFIDELDRCKPTFAIQLIERIKHFFDVPNLVFILLTNRTQIESSIKGIYGSDTNASEYLGKFIHLFLKLPKKSNIFQPEENANRQYLIHLASNYKFDLNVQNNMGFIDAFAIISSVMNMSLRDLEQGMTVFMLNTANRELYPYLAWPIALKIKHPKIFYDIHSNSHRDVVQAHESSIDILKGFGQSDKEKYPESVFHYFRLLHERVLRDISEDDKQFLESNGPRIYYPHQKDGLIKQLIASVDVAFSK